jgi:hypothetical protein
MEIFFHTTAFLFAVYMQKYAITRSVLSMKESKVESYGKEYVECFPRINFPELNRYKAILHAFGSISIALGVMAGIYFASSLGQNVDFGTRMIMLIFPIIIGIMSAFGFYVSSELVGVVLKVQENTYNTAADAEVSSKLLEDILNKLDEVSNK